MSKKILLVEDEALIAMNEALMLKNHGYEVITAYKGEKAVEIIDKDPEISLILMDIDLGKGMDGTEAAVEILPRHEIPIVFLSSHTEPEVVEKTEGITSYGYIVKNSGETVLLTSIKMAFRLYEAHMELKKQKENLNTALIKYEWTAEQLADKNEELESYFSSSLDMLCIADTDGRFIRLNPEWEKVLGYPVSELEGRLFIEFVHEQDREPTLEAAARLKTGDTIENFENRYCCRDGSYRWIEWRSKSIGSTIYAAARDITDRKKAEERLLEREALYRNLMENSIDGVELLDEEGNYLNVNQKECEMLGYSREELLTMKIADIDPNYPKDGFYHFWKEQPKGISILFETLHRHKDGTLIPVEVNGIFITVSGKKYIFGVARDIRDRKRTEYEIKSREENLRITLNSIGDAVISTDVEGNVVSMNPVAENLCGWSIYEAEGKALIDVFHIIHADTGKKMENPVANVLKTGNTIGLENHTMLISKNGEKYQIADSAAPIEDENGNIQGVVLVFRDVTEHYEKERQLEARVKELRSIEWMLLSKSPKQGDYIPEYGNLGILNEGGLILSTAGEAQLKNIASEYLDLLETSSAIYEKNGDYALGVFSSGWCRLMDSASRRLCAAKDNREALKSGKWLCHESCWKNASLAIEQGRPVEIQCNGGINMYAVPVHVNGEVVGAMNFGYGAPPTDETELERLSKKYKVRVRELKKRSEEYKQRPRFIVDYAKKRIQNASKTLGYIIERQQAEEKLREALVEKDFFMKEFNHRIKNNLNIVTSLISLKNSETEIDLSDLKHQVDAIGLIHEKLIIPYSALIITFVRTSISLSSTLRLP